jgi:hypothetical protein
MKATTFAIAAFVFSLHGTAAAQQTAAPEESETPQGIPATQHQEEAVREIESNLFEQLDKDGDGSISQQEARAHSQLSESWNRFDQNGDGSLDQEEFSDFEQSTALKDEAAAGGSRGQTEQGIPATRHQEQAVQDDLIGQLDKDGDGFISEQEAQAEAQLSDNWDSLDENRDGKLDSRELENLEE